MIRIAFVALAGLLLASCGRQGELARPGPLFGRGASQAPAQPSAAVQPDREGDAVEGTGTRRTTPLDPSRTLDPASSAPMEGTTDPVGDRPPVRPNGA
jgi:hypothetical protein